MMYGKCDNCGVEKPAIQGQSGLWFKPRDWFERNTPEDEIVQACSRKCVDEINAQRKKDGKDSKSILPI